ncbi:tetratricopeptide repeat protein [Sphingobacterium chuzhouense]|uniref:Sel1 repeat family protein n=1 Tax=Sphingobacterium chuzhouense TaxID=1742264 RepID=A0ABR7XN33_9SPHI|nr:tetratricopeptide repeat protein [Sphingobacterium chuzhouense]MBD1420585.1 sel1 repeat family protein [Sphingobacterium chuzhouense]
MKGIKSLLTVLMMMLALGGICQDEMKARIEFEEAETYIANEEYEQALNHLNKAETLLGTWSSKIAYQQIVVADKLCSYTDDDDKNGIVLLKQMPLYMAYAKKQGSKIDMDKFKEIYAIESRVNSFSRLVKDSKSPDFVSAKKLYDTDTDLPKAMAQAIKEANNGNVRAMNLVGLLYDKSKQYEEGLLWKKKAVEKGCVFAARNIAVAYLYGQGITQNYTEAMSWFKKAATYGNPYSYNDIGELYVEGIGVEKNEKEAIEWFKKGALKGHKDAVENLGIYLSKAGDYKKAMGYFKYAANKGNTYSMNRIGDFYYEGKGVVKDFATALEWYRKAADLGNGYAMYSIGFMYTKGQGVPMDYKEALVWLEKAVENRDVNAMKEIYEIYSKGGYGIKKDKKLAKEWESKYNEQKK